MRVVMKNNFYIAYLKIPIIGLVISALFISTNVAHTEELDKIFDKVKSLVQSKNYPKAVEELTWAEKEIQKLHLAKLKEFFPAKLGGLQGGKFEVQGAFGMSTVERTYQGEGTDVMVSLVNNSQGGGAGVGALAQLGKMAALMGAQDSGEETIRINGFTARMENSEEGSEPTLSVFLESGSILKIESRSGGNGDKLKKIAEEINIASLDSYLRGQAS